MKYEHWHPAEIPCDHACTVKIELKT